MNKLTDADWKAISDAKIEDMDDYYLMEMIDPDAWTGWRVAIQHVRSELKKRGMSE